MQGRPTVLVVANAVEDCAEVLRSLNDGDDLDVQGPVSALDGLHRCSDQPPDVTVVQLELRYVSGLELCQLLRGRQRTARLPLLLFSSRSGGYEPPGDRLAHVDGFFSAADLGKIVTRVRYLVYVQRETGEGDLLETYHGCHLSANFLRVNVAVDGHRVDLTHRELQLLRFLLSHRNHVLTRHDILVRVWKGENDGGSRTIDTHICRLRVKLRAAGKQIQTLCGVGYRFNEELTSSGESETGRQ